MTLIITTSLPSVFYSSEHGSHIPEKKNKSYSEPHFVECQIIIQQYISTWMIIVDLHLKLVSLIFMNNLNSKGNYFALHKTIKYHI